MMSTLRTSRKSALFLFVIFVVFLIVMFAFKDMNEKLDVMTASNAGYQKMTDSQSDRIKTLQAEIKDLKELHKKNVDSMQESEDKLKSKLSKAQREASEVDEVRQEISKLRSEFDTLSKNHLKTTEELNRVESDNIELKKSNSDQNRQKDSVIMELKDKVAQISLDRDNYKRQYTALFKQDQDNSDTISRLKQEVKRLELQIEDISNQQQQQQSDVSSSSHQAPMVVLPNVPPARASPMSTSTQKESPGAQVNLEEPNGEIQGKISSSTTQGVRQAQEGAGIAQPPLEGVGPAPPNQPEVVQQVGKEDVMEAPGVQDHPFVKQLPQQVQQEHPLQQPRQRAQFAYQPYPQPQKQQQQQLPYLQQQQQQLFHNNLLNQYQQHPVFKGSFNRNRNLVGGGGRGDNLDEEVDQIHPDNFDPVIRGHQAVDDYEGDDAADGQLDNHHHYPVVVQQRNNYKMNDIEYDSDHVQNNRLNDKNIQGRNVPAKNPYLKSQPIVYGDNNNNNNNNNNNQRPLRYLAQPPMKFGGRDF